MGHNVGYRIKILLPVTDETQREAAQAIIDSLMTIKGVTGYNLSSEVLKGDWKEPDTDKHYPDILRELTIDFIAGPKTPELVPTAKPIDITKDALYKLAKTTYIDEKLIWLTCENITQHASDLS